MIKLNGIEVKPTIFPDKTSQVWKVEGISDISNHILWEFENEAEVFQVLQLIGLLNVTYPKSTTLEMPTMPYARQDKAVTNESTFAGHVFVALIDQTGVRVIVNGVHNAKLIPSHWINRKVDDRIKEVISLTNSDVVCYPDKGALDRDYLVGLNFFVLYKERNQSTGEIVGLKLPDYARAEIPAGARVLIVDDLCDGGRTFIEAAKVLYKAGLGIREVNLYTTHGIYSKGVGVLKEGGINRVFNYKGEV